jgi:hypothetical protein
MRFVPHATLCSAHFSNLASWGRVAKEAVTERFATGTNVHQKDMLGSFISRGLTPTELEDELIVQVFVLFP